MIKITALIITLNEEKHVGACIDSLTGVVDEVIVVDSFSTDRTKEIAEAKGVKFIEREFAGFGSQRNIAAMNDAANDWILAIDADEQLSGELKVSIVAFKNSETTAAAYFFNRLNFLADRPIKTCGWYPDQHTRLYDRTKAKWNERHVHEEVETKGELQFQKGDLLHYSYDTIDQLKQKSTRYAKLGAQVYKGKNVLSLIFKMVFSPVFKFIKSYFIQIGFTDGYAGLLISYYRARETFLKYYWALS